MQEDPAQRLNWRWAHTGSDSRPVASVQLHFEFMRDGSKWVGTCVELSTSTYARSRRKTEDALAELVLEHLNLLEETGERNRFFDEWGIKLIIPPAAVPPAQSHGPGSPPSPNVVERLPHQAWGFDPQPVGAGR